MDWGHVPCDVLGAALRATVGPGALHFFGTHAPPSSAASGRVPFARPRASHKHPRPPQPIKASCNSDATPARGRRGPPLRSALAVGRTPSAARLDPRSAPLPQTRAHPARSAARTQGSGAAVARAAAVCPAWKAAAQQVTAAAPRPTLALLPSHARAACRAPRRAPAALGPLFNLSPCPNPAPRPPRLLLPPHPRPAARAVG